MTIVFFPFCDIYRAGLVKTYDACFFGWRVGEMAPARAATIRIQRPCFNYGVCWIARQPSSTSGIFESPLIYPHGWYDLRECYKR